MHQHKGLLNRNDRNETRVFECGSPWSAGVLSRPGISRRLGVEPFPLSLRLPPKAAQESRTPRSAFGLFKGLILMCMRSGRKNPGVQILPDQSFGNLITKNLYTLIRRRAPKPKKRAAVANLTMAAWRSKTFIRCLLVRPKSESRNTRSRGVTKARL